MFPDLSPIEWVSVTSLSLSMAALLARFLTKNNVSAKAHLLTAVAVLAIVSAGLSVASTFRRSAEVNALAESIYIAIGNQEKTTEQLLLELGARDDRSFAAAVDLLKTRHRLESRIEQATFNKDRQVTVRLWRAVSE